MMDIYAKKIPIEVKVEVIETIKRVQLNKIRAERKDIKYLFKIYREYLAPHDSQNIECRACRAKVLGIFFSILRIWNKTS